MSNRAVVPVVGVVLLVAVTVIAASAVAAGVLGTPGPPGGPTAASFDAGADATGEIRVVHTGGDTIDPDDLEVAIRVDGEPLESQPPVPFFSARGFESGPTGVFNSATRGRWRAGEAASLAVAGSNEPSLSAGATVEVRITVDDVPIAALEATVQAASTASPSPSMPASPPASSSATSRSAPGSAPPPASVSGT